MSTTFALNSPLTCHQDDQVQADLEHGSPRVVHSEKASVRVPVVTVVQTRIRATTVTCFAIAHRLFPATAVRWWLPQWGSLPIQSSRRR